MTNVLPIYPDGIPKNIEERLNRIFGHKRPEDIRAANVFSGEQSKFNLRDERVFLHATLDSTLESLYSMSPFQKHETFVGLSNSMKMVFDLYMEEKCKPRLI